MWRCFQHRFTCLHLNSGVIGQAEFAALKKTRDTGCLLLGGDLSKLGANLCT